MPYATPCVCAKIRVTCAILKKEKIFAKALDTPKKSAIIRNNYAGIAQLVEHNLAKVGVASSNLVSRSRFKKSKLKDLDFLFWIKANF